MRSSNDWNAYTVKYLDQDSLVKYIIPYNSDGEVEENIYGIALSSYSYDEQGREIERRYYDSEGKLHFSDWPPIIKLEYNEKGLVRRKTYYGEDEKIMMNLARFEFEYDEDGDIIVDKIYNGKLELIRSKNLEYNTSKNVVIESNYEENNEFVSRYKIVYETNGRERMLELHHFNESNEYIEIENKTSGEFYSVMVFHYDFKPNWAKVELLDKDLNIVHEYSQYVPSKKK